MLEISQIALPLDAFSSFNHSNEVPLVHVQDISDPALLQVAKSAVVDSLGIDKGDIRSLRILKRSIDARKKSNVHFVVTLGVELRSAEQEARLIEALDSQNIRKHQPYEPLLYPNLSCPEKRPIVVGTGPAGLFAALYLARAGLKPLVLEQGEAVEQRVNTVNSFLKGAVLNPSSNVQFGEGGAGTFSDGKLTTGIKSPYIRHVLRWFYEAGAPEEILWLSKPHLGTDKLPGIVKGLRQKIREAGGAVHFNTKLTDVQFDSGVISQITAENLQTGEQSSYQTNALFLACGHSARDTFEMLHRRDVALEQKPFSLGVRIEHPQSLIDQAQYGKAYRNPTLGAADYKLAVHLEEGRGVYTFCMCPGGEVVPAASEAEGLVVNGMSRFARDADNANSALLVGVDPQDFGDTDVLSGVELQRRIERVAFELVRSRGGKPYEAPAQTVGDFLSGTQGAVSKTVTPSYSRGVQWVDLHSCLPDFVSRSLEQALPLLDKRLRGFASADAVLTGVETRSSSPVRICRDESFQASVEVEQHDFGSVSSGLYPCGEGSGYAGGITSSAIDGIRCAEAYCNSLR